MFFISMPSGIPNLLLLSGDKEDDCDWLFIFWAGSSNWLTGDTASDRGDTVCDWLYDEWVESIGPDGQVELSLLGIFDRGDTSQSVLGFHGPSLSSIWNRKKNFPENIIIFHGSKLQEFFNICILVESIFCTICFILSCIQSPYFAGQFSVAELCSLAYTA